MKKKVKTYEEWLALGPELAAKYLSDKNNHTPAKRRKVALILKEFWDDGKTTPWNKHWDGQYKKSLEK